MITLLVLSFLITFILGIPLAFVLGITGFLCIMAMGVPLQVVAQRMFTGLDSFPLMAVPFFILAGELMNRGGTTIRIIRFANSLIGYINGGLAHSNVVANMLFAGISGSAVADASAIGSIMIPAMEKNGYETDFSAALTSAAATIGPIIPPSIIMVIYGVSVNVSIGGLFAAGFIPGVMLGLAMMFMIFLESKTRHYPPVEKFSFKKILTEGKDAFWALLSPIIILGGILFGVFTPTEAAAVAVIYSLITGLLIYKELKWKDLPAILLHSGTMMATILIIISTANVLAWVIAANMIPYKIAMALFSISHNKYFFIFIINIFLLLVGMFMETGAAIIILSPILAPIAMKMGIHPLHFGFMMVLNLAIGMATPPVGVCLFVSSSITGLPLEKISKAAFKFVMAEIVVLAIVSYIEPISLFLPRALGFIR